MADSLSPIPPRPASAARSGFGWLRTADLHQTPVWAILLLSAAVVGAIGTLQFIIFPDRVAPLTYNLPLLLCLWHRDRRVLFVTAAIFTVMSATKLLYVLPNHLDIYAEGNYKWIAFGMQTVNIWVPAFVINWLIVARMRLAATNAALAQANGQLEANNAELSATNEELAQREEEIVRQNEELQSQTEELEQQAEQLRQQAEEVEQQSADLHEANDELTRRERGLHTLLESGRWMRTDLDEQIVTNGICQAAVQVLGSTVQASALIEQRDGQLSLRGHSGFGINGAIAETIDFHQSFASLIIERGQTAFLEDVDTRPDLRLPQPAAGKPFRSVLGSPIWVDGKPVGALEVYSAQPQQWTAEQFHVLEWLSAQCAISLRAIRSQKELEQKRREAEDASQAKTRFLAAVSHDVRTPANAISLLADLIEQTARDPQSLHEVPEMASDLKNNAKSLVELVSDVLDLARFDAGKLEVHASEFSLAALVEAEVRAAQPLAQAKGLELKSNLSPGGGLWLRTDRMKLARVLGNLLGNAIKFTETGTVLVQCEPAGDGGVRLSVIDTGVGISPEYLPRIFDEFFQLRNPERDRSKGTGLGLAICRRLVDGIGCRLSVSSALHEGSAFTVHVPGSLMLPFGPIHANPAAAILAPGAQPLASLCVMLVDDHDVTRETVAQLLRSRGARVITAALGREALRLLAHESPDVLLLDLMLPDLDGADILRHVRDHAPASLRCVLALSGDVRPSRIEEVRALGAADLIPKPVTIDRLVDALNTHCPVRPHAPSPTVQSNAGPA
jgi:signal transduction histidine kinase/CheY-like chemotaxis protein